MASNPLIKNSAVTAFFSVIFIFYCFIHSFMSKEALEDIILKSVEDAVSTAVDSKKCKPHFLVDENEAQQYVILLRNYYNLKNRDDVPVLRAFCREVHEYLLSITSTDSKKQVVVSGISAFKNLEDYDEQDAPEVDFAGETSPMPRGNVLVEKVKNASLGTTIACTAFYALIQHPLALPIGIPALGVHIGLRIYDHFTTNKNQKKKGNLMALNAFLESTDFMLVEDVLDENKDKILAYIDKVYFSPV